MIGACTVFGAICGSSVATTATFGRAALPELRRYGYEPGFATGTIAIGGVVDLLIPPSIILVVYAIVTEQNIAKLFQAALIPGLIAVAFYCVVIALMVRWKPALAPTLREDAAARPHPFAGRSVARAPDHPHRDRGHLRRRLHADRSRRGRRRWRCLPSACCSAR